MLNNADNLNQDKSTNRRPWVSSGTQTMEMCPTASITLACLITFHHFQSCLRPPTIPTAQAFPSVKTSNEGQFTTIFSSSSEAMMPRTFPLSQDGRQKQWSSVCSSSSPYWWIFTWESVVRNEDLRTGIQWDDKQPIPKQCHLQNITSWRATLMFTVGCVQVCM